MERGVYDVSCRTMDFALRIQRYFWFWLHGVVVVGSMLLAVWDCDAISNAVAV